MWASEYRPLHCASVLCLAAGRIGFGDAVAAAVEEKASGSPAALHRSSDFVITGVSHVASFIVAPSVETRSPHVGYTSRATTFQCTYSLQVGSSRTLF